MSGTALALLSLASATGLFGFLAWRQVARLPGKRKKALLKKTINGVFIGFEERGWLPRTPAFDHDYHARHPSLALLEEHHPEIQQECLALLGRQHALTDIAKLGGSYTEHGIHTAAWKTFMFKSGKFIDANCALCPKTAALLRQIPGVYTAFFSVLEPRQVLTPHWGYYKGFLRYHLGVVIPKNNADRKCYLRVNADAADNARRDPDLIENGETYYWKNGEGVVFDDNYVHDAANLSDEVRVVLWLDIRRPMPWPLQAFNMLCLAIAHRDPSVRKIRENALVAR